MNNVFLAYPKAGFRTAGLQALIDQCAQAGGGQVRLTPGSYLTATLYLKSHVELYLDAGAEFRGPLRYIPRNQHPAWTIWLILRDLCLICG